MFNATAFPSCNSYVKFDAGLLLEAAQEKALQHEGDAADKKLQPSLPQLSSGSSRKTQTTYTDSTKSLYQADYVQWSLRTENVARKVKQQYYPTPYGTFGNFRTPSSTYRSDFTSDPAEKPIPLNELSEAAREHIRQAMRHSFNYNPWTLMEQQLQAIEQQAKEENQAKSNSDTTSDDAVEQQLEQAALQQPQPAEQQAQEKQQEPEKKESTDTKDKYEYFEHDTTSKIVQQEKEKELELTQDDLDELYQHQQTNPQSGSFKSQTKQVEPINLQFSMMATPSRPVSRQSTRQSSPVKPSTPQLSSREAIKKVPPLLVGDKLMHPNHPMLKPAASPLLFAGGGTRDPLLSKAPPKSAKPKRKYKPIPPLFLAPSSTHPTPQASPAPSSRPKRKEILPNSPFLSPLTSKFKAPISTENLASPSSGRPKSLSIPSTPAASSRPSTSPSKSAPPTTGPVIKTINKHDTHRTHTIIKRVGTAGGIRTSISGKRSNTTTQDRVFNPSNSIICQIPFS